jgi:acetolactate decarboxylase
MAAAAGCSAVVPTELNPREIYYQVSTFDALNAGLFEGMVSIDQLRARGDFGIGTTEGLNGEMVVLDGRFYRIRHDGGAEEIGGEERASFAMLTYFDRDATFEMPAGLDYPAAGKYIDGRLPTLNAFQAIRLQGVFSRVKARSPARQDAPYPNLTEALKNQSIFEFKDIEGVMVGWRFPNYSGGINAAGYHFHLLTADRKGGGHVLDFTSSKVSVFIDHTPGLLVRLPEGDSSFDKLQTGPQ